VAITLGKDCTVSAGGNVASARNVTFSSSARTIEVEEFGSRYSTVYTTGYESSVSIEFNDSSDAFNLWNYLRDGTVITVSGGSGGWSFPAVVTSISETCPIDGVATFTVEARLTRQGLR
jgi:hypothetical protein